MISTYLILGLIFVILLIVIVLVLVKFSRSKQNQTAVSHCQDSLKTIVIDLSPDNKDNPIASNIWIEILDQNEYLKILSKSGSMIIFGDPSKGLSSVLRYTAYNINQQFNHTNRMGMYIDIRDIPFQVGSIETALPDEVYRSVITSTIDRLLWNVEQKAGEKTYRQSGLYDLDIQLKDELSNSIIEMPITEIGQTLNKLMKLLNIKQIKICLDNVSVLQPSTLPFVLSLLVRTFQSSGQIDLVFGGVMDKLQLITDTSEGPVGIQFGHDIFLGLNLHELLLPQIDLMVDIEKDESPRMQFIKKSLETLALYPGAKNDTLILYTREVFTSSDVWKTLFQYFNGDLQQIIDILSPLLQWARENNKKVSLKNYQDIYQQCQSLIVK